MKFYSILFLLIIFKKEIEVIQNAEVKCDRKTEVQMDYALAKLLVVGQNKLKFPVNGQQLRPYCNEALRLFDMVSQYTKSCLNKFGRDSAQILLHSINVELRSICKSGRLTKKARELLSIAPCANAGLKDFQKCNINIIDAYMGLLNADVKIRIPMGCCNYHELIKCLQNEAEEVRQCTPKQIDYLINYVNNIMQGILQFLCTQYDESNSKCDTLVRDTPKRNATQKRYKSVLLPTIHIAMSLDEDNL